MPGEAAGDGAAAQHHHPGGVLDGERAGDARCGEFTLRVPEHGVRSDPEVGPQSGQRDHHRERHRLHDVDPVEGRGTVNTPDHVKKGPVDQGGQCLGALADRLREDGVGVQEFGSHARPLGALPGEHEDDPAAGVGSAGHQPWHRHAVGEASHGGGLGAVPGEQDRAVLHPRTSGGEGEPDGHGVGPRRVHGGQQAGRLRAERVLAGGGHHPRNDLGARSGGARRWAGVHGRCLFQDQVRVGAADAERGDTGAARPVPLRPRHGLPEEGDGPGGPVHLRGGLVDVQGPRQDAVPHGLHHLDDPGDPGRRLGVPDVRLQRAQPQRAVRRPVLAVGGQQRLGLDGVTEPGTRAVRLHGVHVGGTESRRGERATDHPLLRGPAGCGETVGRAVGVDRGTAHDGEDGMPVPACLGKPLQEQDGHALRPPRSVGGRGERLAPPVARQRSLPAELHEHPGRGHHRHPTGERHRALTGAQRLRCQVHGDQGRRAGGVDGHRRAFESQRVRDAAGRHAARRPDVEVALGLGGHLVESVRVVVVHQPGEDADIRAAQRRRVQASAFDDLPRRLQQQPLLGVHGECLAGGDPEGRRVEVTGVVEETALPGDGRAGPALGAEEGVEVPAPVVREPGDRVHALLHQRPQLFR